MRRRPDYFDAIRNKAANRWDQLEGDPELAGPWHLLFDQIQSPRHVFSELLQNADDADAHNVSANIKDGVFIFEHDGEDFSDEHLASLCRFGYSNKRNLHTIGFRGIGFKSTFSLGGDVKLLTPTLSILFRKARFTEPVWLLEEKHIETTQIQVRMLDERRQEELERNLSEWATNPVSLLFFRNIHSINIQGDTITRRSMGQGPVDNSEWVELSEEQDKPYLLVRSSEQEFPAESVAEIRQTRMGTENLELPPCQIDLVVGSDIPSKLFVVLPTGVETELPFICNAPFIQDPARVQIKDPGTSATNCWLLERAGKLAADTMLEWLRNDALSIEERSKAYCLFPDVDREDNTIEGECNRICEVAFESSIDGQEAVLTEEGGLVRKEECISCPSDLYDIWSPSQISSVFDEEHRPVLHHSISEEHRSILEKWSLVSDITTSEVLDQIESSHCPRPGTWSQLLILWGFVANNTSRYSRLHKRTSMHILPVQGKNVLCAASDVVRLGKKKLLMRQEDWDFLSKHLLVINQNWIRFIAEQRKIATERDDEQKLSLTESAEDLLESYGLDEASDVSEVVHQVASLFFQTENLPLSSCVTLAHIAATLNASIGDGFQYGTLDGHRKNIDDHIVADIDHRLSTLVNDEWYRFHVLHPAYFKNFESCREAEWNRWTQSDRSRISTFVPLMMKKQKCESRRELESICQERGIENYSCPYVTDNFIIEDWDFDNDHWKCWESQSLNDESFWAKVFVKIISMPKRDWTKALSIKVSQVATTGTTQSITSEEATPAWIMKFRGLPCLQDTHGWYRKPTELFRRTPETEPLLDVENFVKAEVDTEQNKPLLIKLGLLDKPTGPDLLLQRLKGLAKTDHPPVYEVQKWCNRLDQMLGSCSTENQQLIKNTFANESIIFTAGGNWARSNEVFLQADAEEVPDAPLVHPTLSHLSLWGKVGVPLRPTAELALDWLKSIEGETNLSPDEIRRVRSLLARYAINVWTECQCWLNLDGQWVDVDQLDYKLTMQSLTGWGNLFPEIKQSTADCRSLSVELCNSIPFSDLPNLANHIEERIEEGLFQLSEASEKTWIQTLGSCISRIIIDDEIEATRIQQHAQRLAITQWQPVSGLEVVPFIDGTPAGTAKTTDAAWKDTVLFVEDRRLARLYKSIAQELARPFDRSDITEAVKACVDRSPEFIIDYFEENFKLAPPVPIEAETTGKSEDGAVVSSEKDDEPAERTSNYDDHDSGITADTVNSGSTAPADDLHDPGADKESEQEPPEPFVRIHTPKPTKPSLIELFAKSLGYSMDGHSDRFYHNDGSWIQKAMSNSAFPWERYSTEGELQRCYWTKEHCIYSQPLQLSAELWNLCGKHPDKYSLVIIDREGNPLELTGNRLQKLINDGLLTLHPATYRLILDTEKTDGINL